MGARCPGSRVGRLPMRTLGGTRPGARTAMGGTFPRVAKTGCMAAHRDCVARLGNAGEVTTRSVGAPPAPSHHQHQRSRAGRPTQPPRAAQTATSPVPVVWSRRTPPGAAAGDGNGRPSFPSGVSRSGHVTQPPPRRPAPPHRAGTQAPKPQNASRPIPRAEARGMGPSAADLAQSPAEIASASSVTMPRSSSQASVTVAACVALSVRGAELLIR